MNLVAHQLLSFNEPAIQAGNHLGEVVKGKITGFPQLICKGIALHRHIDSFTDNHYIVKKSTLRLHKDYKKYAPILVDIFYDYLLIKNWKKFSEINFNTFKQQCYKTLLEYAAYYPAPLKKQTHAMVHHDWFSKYGTLEGVELTLKNIARRARFENNMHMAIKTLYLEEEKFNTEFLIFFPEILKSCETFLKQ